MINGQQSRLTAFRTRIPALVLIVLYGIAVLAAGFTGYASGLRSRRQCLPFMAVGVVFAAVILLVQDVDRPEAGSIRVDQQPLVDVAASLAGYR
jgi:zinc transporter ZupT